MTQGQYSYILKTLDDAFHPKQNRTHDMSKIISMPFGKHKGTSLSDMATHSPGYLQWILSLGNSDSGFGAWGHRHREQILDALREDKLEELHTNFPEFTLSPSQKEAVRQISTGLLMDDTNHMFRLQGAAGYGKSFSTMEIVRQAMEMGYTVTACAVSYVASQNLLKDLSPIGVECKTIASQFRLSREFEEASEKYILTGESFEAMRSYLGENQLVIVDEYSMVEDTVAQYLIDVAHEMGGKLLVVGDVGQLPSPAQDHDSLFNKVEPHTSLTDPMRYKAGSDLHRVEQAVRENPYQFDVSPYTESATIKTHAGYGAFVDAYVGSYQDNPHAEVKMLWYRRKDVIQSNQDIRYALFGPHANVIEEDEQLMVMRTSDTPVYAKDTRQRMVDEYGKPATKRLYSGQNFRVNELQEDVVKFIVETEDEIIEFTIPVYRAVLSNKAQVDLIFSVSETQANADVRGGSEYNAALKHIADLCIEKRLPWAKYHEFKNLFLAVAHSYATTVHRSQGASLDIVYTSLHALLSAQPFVAKKLAYVGMTRAKKELHLLT